MSTVSANDHQAPEPILADNPAQSGEDGYIDLNDQRIKVVS